MRRQPDFKSTQVFDWASEPADERPTDFGRSTGYSALSGFGALHEARTPSARRRQQHRNGLIKLALTGAIFLGMSVVGMTYMVRFLQA